MSDRRPFALELAGLATELGGIVLTRESGDGDGMSITEAVAFCAGECARRPTERPRCASPVLMAWMTTWAERLDDGDRQQLRRYVLPLATSRGNDDEETARVWLVIDWLIRTHGSLWLGGAQLPRQAEALTSLTAVRSSEDLANAYPMVRDANEAARRAADLAWLFVTRDALLLPVRRARCAGVGPVDDWELLEPANAHRLEAWAAVAETITDALRSAETLLDCALSAVGYGTAPVHEAPQGMGASTRAVTNAAAAIGWSAMRALSTQDAWCWETTADAAAQAAAAAVRSALQPVEEQARDSAHDLIERLL